MNYEKGKCGTEDIYERTVHYALRSVKFYRYLIKRGDGVGLILGKQFFRAAKALVRIS
jgi:hypothetical protein